MSVHFHLRGSYTVEAVFLMPLLCLLLIGLFLGTLENYRRVEEYGRDCIAAAQAVKSGSEVLRMERILGKLGEEVWEHGGGI